MEIVKPKPSKFCPECSGPNGYHSRVCSLNPQADGFIASLNPDDYKLLAAMRISVAPPAPTDL
jgi:hypothetical protein